MTNKTDFLEIDVFEIIPTNNFNKDMKYYIKKKKYKNITKDIEPILESLSKGEFLGDEIADLKLGEDKTYKVRIANSDTKSGKSNGYRLIYYVEVNDKIIFLVTIYHKKDDERILTDTEIVNIIKENIL